MAHLSRRRHFTQPAAPRSWHSSSLDSRALVFARLSRTRLRSTLAPRQKIGGPYVYTREAFGDFPGFLVAWGYWISIWTTNAAIAVAFVSYMTLFWPPLGANAVLAVGLGLATIWGLTWVNVLGVLSYNSVVSVLAFALWAIAGGRPRHRLLGLFALDARRARLCLDSPWQVGRFAVKIRALLEVVSELQDRRFVEMPSDELDADR